jgi:integrase
MRRARVVRRSRATSVLVEGRRRGSKVERSETSEGGKQEESVERPTAAPEQVWQLADLMPERFACLVLLAGFGNLRLSELLGLERRHINPLQRKISVRQGVHQLARGRLVITEPKSAAGRRTFTLPSELMDVLNEHLATFSGPGPDARVFTGEKGGALRRHVLAKHWRKARARVDLPDGFVFHDLRHTAQTLGGKAGATLADLKRRGGHSSVQAVMRYQHATEEGDRRIADSMNAMLIDSRTKRAMNAPSPQLWDASREPLRVEPSLQPAICDESGRRESNPRSQLGKLMFCR